MPINNIEYRGFNIDFDRSVDELVSSITIFPLLTLDKTLVNTPFEVEALWDTGATVTCIKPKLFNRLNLIISDASEYTMLAGVGGNVEANTTFVNLFIGNQIKIEYCKVFVVDFPGSAEILIGMDIIAMGDFAVCNAEDKTSLSFVMPPFPDRINLSDKAKAVNRSGDAFSERKITRNCTRE